MRIRASVCMFAYMHVNEYMRMRMCMHGCKCVRVHMGAGCICSKGFNNERNGVRKVAPDY